MSVSDSTYPATFGDGASVLERILLAIINGHTTDETAGRQSDRLQAAMTALIGPATPKQRGLERALLFMVRERQKDICDIEMRSLHSEASVPKPSGRSVPELAKVAAREVLGFTTAAEVMPTTHMLCAMFQDRFGNYARELDDVREALEAEAVQRFCDELAEWDVPTKI